MGVYISGMEIPKTCEDCNLKSFCNLCADEFISYIRKNLDSYDQRFAEMVEARPTIIPAEESES